MFLNFFNELRSAKIPVTLKEYLALMEAMDKDVIDMDVEDFYFLSRTALVKDERNLDKFDKVFGQVFKGLEGVGEAIEVADLPRMAPQNVGEVSDARRDERDRGPRRLGKADGDAERAPRRAEKAP